jgi:hypothetical protein
MKDRYSEGSYLGMLRVKKGNYSATAVAIGSIKIRFKTVFLAVREAIILLISRPESLRSSTASQILRFFRTLVGRCDSAMSDLF